LRAADKSIEPSLKDHLLADFRIAPITDVEKAMLVFAEKATVSCATIGESDLEPLRAHDLDDKAIHDLVQVVAYFNYVNRIADALGVELEEGYKAG